MPKIHIYDTTLRDGMQSEGVNYSLEDKLNIAKRLDGFGISFIEGGWPGASEIDTKFFEKCRGLEFAHAKLVAFGSTRRASLNVKEDPYVKALLDCGTEYITIFGKTWDFQVSNVFGIDIKDGLDMIYDTVGYLTSEGRKVIFDAEHFFDGYKNNPDYALNAVKRAAQAGAVCVALCETNGGALPSEVKSICEAALKCLEKYHIPLGIHAHNDSDMAVANTIAAVEAGITHVQGTMNGIGERCGNANLCSIIPIIETKMGLDCLNAPNLNKLTGLSLYIDEVANRTHDSKLPFVGEAAFAHKAGVHADAVEKNPKTYEHIDPAVVGNSRKILISSYAGAANVLAKALRFEPTLKKNSPIVKEMLKEIVLLEKEGYCFDVADASFDLIILKHLNRLLSNYLRENTNTDFLSFLSSRFGDRIIERWERLGTLGKLSDVLEYNVLMKSHVLTMGTDTKVSIDIHRGVGKWTFEAEGDGPVHAFDNALRDLLMAILDKDLKIRLKKTRLTDFKVRVVDSNEATDAKVRVLIESVCGSERWCTVGVSGNIIEACWIALVDSVEYGLLSGIIAQKEAEKN